MLLLSSTLLADTSGFIIKLTVTRRGGRETAQQVDRYLFYTLSLPTCSSAWEKFFEHHPRYQQLELEEGMQALHARGYSCVGVDLIENGREASEQLGSTAAAQPDSSNREAP